MKDKLTDFLSIIIVLVCIIIEFILAGLTTVLIIDFLIPYDNIPDLFHLFAYIWMFIGFLFLYHYIFLHKLLFLIFDLVDKVLNWRH